MRAIALALIGACIAPAARAQDVAPRVPSYWASDSVASADWHEGYHAGQADAVAAAANGRRVVITGGLVDWYTEWVEELAPLGVELLWHTGCEPTPHEDGYVEGYVSVMKPLLVAEIGEAALTAAEARGRARMVERVMGHPNDR